MAKIPRKAQKIFGSNAGSNGITKFGSTAAGSTVYSTDLDDIQSLTAYQTGWLGAVMSGTKRKPVYQDRNALDYLFSSQLANIFQDGIPVYNSATPYYTGSIVRQDGTSILYKSLIDNNTGNTLTDGSNWKLLGDLSILTSINNDPDIINHGNVSTGTLALTANRYETATVGANMTISLPAITTTNKLVVCTLKLVNGTTLYTITQPTVVWRGAVTPALTTTSATYTITYWTDDNGTTWHGTWAKEG